MNNLYKTIITFAARDDHEARIINTAVSRAAIRQIPETRTVRMKRVLNWPTITGSVWLGITLLLVAFAYILYCVATGFWR